MLNPGRGVLAAAAVRDLADHVEAYVCKHETVDKAPHTTVIDHAFREQFN